MLYVYALIVYENKRYFIWRRKMSGSVSSLRTAGIPVDQAPSNLNTKAKKFYKRTIRNVPNPKQVYNASPGRTVVGSGIMVLGPIAHFTLAYYGSNALQIAPAFFEIFGVLALSNAAGQARHELIQEHSDRSDDLELQDTNPQPRQEGQINEAFEHDLDAASRDDPGYPRVLTLPNAKPPSERISGNESPTQSLPTPPLPVHTAGSTEVYPWSSLQTA